MMILEAADSVYAQATARSRQRAELLSARRRLDGRSHRESRHEMVNARDQDERRACHFETRRHASPVEARWNSAFVAQILGQDLLTKTIGATLGERAYAHAAREAPVQRLIRLI